jgi:hypothetical protein
MVGFFRCLFSPAVTGAFIVIPAPRPSANPLNRSQVGMKSGPVSWVFGSGRGVLGFAAPLRL